MLTIILYFIDGLSMVLLNKPLLCNSLFHGDKDTAFILLLLDFLLELFLLYLVKAMYR